jgi:hypothetical protein
MAKKQNQSAATVHADINFQYIIVANAISREKEMTWFQDDSHHILESKSNMHRLLYCPLCQKLISKTKCQKIRQDKDGIYTM